MANQKYFVKSNFRRVPGDYYPTIDPRCIYGFLEHFSPVGLVVDPCAPQGSGIVDTLQERGVRAMGLPDAFGKFSAEWIVCNPPYSRGIVDLIISDGIKRVERGEVVRAAYLLRMHV